MEDFEQIVYPWGLYDTSEIEELYFSPYTTAIVEILAWSGDATYRYWMMLFGLNGWVPTGQGWIEKWNTDFEWHRISDVTRDLRGMTEDWKVNLQSGLDDWEGETFCILRCASSTSNCLATPETLPVYVTTYRK